MTNTQPTRLGDMSTRRLLLSPLLLLVALATILGAGTVSASAAAMRWLISS